jgi:hypothetical protein
MGHDQQPPEKKYTLAKYADRTKTRIITGVFKDVEEMFSVFHVDTNYYFILKIEERDPLARGGWKTLLDRTFVFSAV